MLMKYCFNFQFFSLTNDQWFLTKYCIHPGSGLLVKSEFKMIKGDDRCLWKGEVDRCDKKFIT